MTAEARAPHAGRIAAYDVLRWAAIVMVVAIHVTGYATLQAVLGERDMTGFLRRWEKYVLALRFPEE